MQKIKHFSLLKSVGPSSGFLLYAGFGIVGFIFLYIFLPETKSVPLEEIPALLDRAWVIPRSNNSYKQFENQSDRLPVIQ